MRKNKKEPKELVENCLALDIKRFIEEVSMSGNTTLNNSERSLDIQYGVSDNILSIEYGEKNQCLEIVKMPAFRGVKTFFVCLCGKRCKKLYLKPDGEWFVCRMCCNLTYLSTRLCKDTVNGAIFNDFNRVIRLIERREVMQSFYRGRPTKKFLKLMRDARRYGFHGFIKEQQNAMEEIRMMRDVVNFAKGGSL